jgi:predicted Zn-dependent peptidase
VSKLTVNDLGAFYKMNYNPNHAAISVVGDFNSKESAALTVLFSKWKKSSKEEESPASKLLSPKKTGYY